MSLRRSDSKRSLYTAVAWITLLTATMVASFLCFAGTLLYMITWVVQQILSGFLGVC